MKINFLSVFPSICCPLHHGYTRPNVFLVYWDYFLFIGFARQQCVYCVCCWRHHSLSAGPRHIRWAAAQRWHGGRYAVGDPEHFCQDGAAAFLGAMILHFVPTKNTHYFSSPFSVAVLKHSKVPSSPLRGSPTRRTLTLDNKRPGWWDCSGHNAMRGGITLPSIITQIPLQSDKNWAKYHQKGTHLLEKVVFCCCPYLWQNTKLCSFLEKSPFCVPTCSG